MTTPTMTSKLSRTAGAIALAVLALATARAASAALMQLPDDPRPWTEKVAPDLMARAAVATGDLDVLIAFRQPAARAGAQRRRDARSGAPAVDRGHRATRSTRDWAPGGVKVLERLSLAPIVHAIVPVALLPALAEDPRVDAIALNHKVHALDADRPGVHARGRDPAAEHRRRCRHRVPRHRCGLHPP